MISSSNKPIASIKSVSAFDTGGGADLCLAISSRIFVLFVDIAPEFAVIPNCAAISFCLFIYDKELIVIVALMRFL